MATRSAPGRLPRPSLASPSPRSPLLELRRASRKSQAATSTRRVQAHARRQAQAHAKAEALRQPESERVNALPITHRHAAGIDIGGSSHWVCVGFTPDDDSPLVRELPAHTAGLQQLVAFLRAHHVRTVALEATGIYWVPLHELLEGQGFEVLLVDPSYTKQVKGRPTTDKRDAQWIYRLHAVGLLAGAFRPDEKTCAGAQVPASCGPTSASGPT